MSRTRDFSAPRREIHPLLVLIVLALVCILEAGLHWPNDYLLINGVQASTLSGALRHYPHAYTFDNNLDRDIIHPEGVGLARNAYDMAGSYKPGRDYHLDVSAYGGDMYRIMLPFLASFLLGYFELRQAYMIINVLVWIITSFAVYRLGRRLFQDAWVGLAAGLLCASSYALIVLSSTSKSEFFQVAGFFLLVAAAFELDHFSNDRSRRALFNSFVLGLCAGLAMFGSWGSAFFAAFLATYSLYALTFKNVWIRNLALLAGFLSVYLLLTGLMIEAEMSPSAFLLEKPHRDFWALLSCEAWRFTGHFIYIVPLPLWLLAAGGLYRIKRQPLAAIVCMFSTLLVSEAIMDIVQGASCFYWSINYYYVQILLPIYLLAARCLVGLFQSGPRPFVIAAKRSIAVLAILVVLAISNLSLVGNHYYYFVGYRPTSIQVLYHSFFTFDNLSVYREKFDAPEAPQ